MKLVFIHENVENETVLLEAFKNDCILQKMSEEPNLQTIIKNFGSAEISHVAFVYHYMGYSNIPFNFPKLKENCPTCGDVRLENNSGLELPDHDENDKSYKFTDYLFFNDSLVSLFKQLREKNGNLTVDILTCNLNEPDFIKEVSKVEKDLQIDIRYSLDQTGNNPNGNWTLESDSVNIQNEYFTDKIQEWNGVLLATINNIALETLVEGASLPRTTFITRTLNVPNDSTKGATYILQRNIKWVNVRTSEGQNVNTSSIQLGAYDIFDGNGFSINLETLTRNALFATNYDTSKTTKEDLFNSGSQIKNLGIIGGNLSFNSGNGYFIGRFNRYFKIDNCYSTGNISGFSGGICGGYSGYSGKCEITNCYSTGSIDINGGGICGERIGAHGEANISNCYSNGSIGSGGGGVCSLECAYVGKCNIENCYSTGLIGKAAGGICGQNVGQLGNITIKNCYSTGNQISVNGGGICGQVAGREGYCQIENCYSTGLISGGGICASLAGYNGYCLIKNSYSTGAINGGGGICGSSAADLGGTCIIQSCYSTGSLNNNSGGGIVGTTSGTNFNNSSIFCSGVFCFKKDSLLLIQNCFSLSNINSELGQGGIAASNPGSFFIDKLGKPKCIIQNCYSNGIPSGNDNNSDFKTYVTERGSSLFLPGRDILANGNYSLDSLQLANLNKKSVYNISEDESIECDANQFIANSTEYPRLKSFTQNPWFANNYAKNTDNANFLYLQYPTSIPRSLDKKLTIVPVINNLPANFTVEAKLSLDFTLLTNNNIASTGLVTQTGITPLGTLYIKDSTSKIVQTLPIFINVRPRVPVFTNSNITQKNNQYDLISISPVFDSTKGDQPTATIFGNDASAVTYKITSGTLPQGLSLNSTNGIISGNVTEFGPKTIQLSCSNNNIDGPNGTRAIATQTIQFDITQTPVNYLDFETSNSYEIDSTILLTSEQKQRYINNLTPVTQGKEGWFRAPSISSNPPSVYFTEICLDTELPGAALSYLSYPEGFIQGTDTKFTRNYFELRGIPGASIAGLIFELWQSDTTATVTFSLPNNAVVNSNGFFFIIPFKGNYSDNPQTSVYFGNTNFIFNSTSNIGVIIRDSSGNIIDAVGYSGSTQYSFPVAAGVGTLWTVTKPLQRAQNTAGIRLSGDYDRSDNNWTVASNTNRQNPNMANQQISPYKNISLPFNITYKYKKVTDETTTYENASFNKLNISNLGFFQLANDSAKPDNNATNTLEDSFNIINSSVSRDVSYKIVNRPDIQYIIMDWNSSSIKTRAYLYSKGILDIFVIQGSGTVSYVPKQGYSGISVPVTASNIIRFNMTDNSFSNLGYTIYNNPQLNIFSYMVPGTIEDSTIILSDSNEIDNVSYPIPINNKIIIDNSAIFMFIDGAYRRIDTLTNDINVDKFINLLSKTNNIIDDTQDNADILSSIIVLADNTYNSYNPYRIINENVVDNN